MFQSVTKLFLMYLKEASLFFIIHLILTIAAFHAWQRIREEQDALANWTPGTPGQTECTSVLEQFVSESEHWGRNGILVPLTDFTDRLDSRVEGLVDHLTSLVNLYLIIGVAGTFYGLFGFASQIASGPQSGSDAGALIARALSQGLANSFPVSIFGILWMIVGHFFASRAEGSLRSSLTVATQRALKRRREVGGSLAESIQRVLEPFQDISKALNEGMAPVITQFIDKVGVSAGKIAEQFEPFASSVQTFRVSAEGIGAAAERLALVVEESKVQMLQIKSVRDNLSLRTTKMMEKMERLEAVMSDAAKNLESGAQQIERISTGLAGAVEKSLGSLRDSTARQWADACGQYFAALEPVRKCLSESAQKLEEACDNWQNTPAAMSGTFERAFTELSVNSLENWKRVTESLVQAQDTRLSSLSEQSKESCRKLADAADSIHGVAIHSKEILRDGVGEFVKAALIDCQSQLVDLQKLIGQESPEAIQAVREVLSDISRCRGAYQQLAAEVAVLENATRKSALSFSQSVDRLAEVSGKISNITYPNLNVAIQDLTAEVRSVRNGKENAKVWRWLRGR